MVNPDPKQKALWVAKATWPEVQRRLEAGAPALLPIGAACKEHGYHLPLNTDLLQAEWLVRALVKTVEVVIWPTLSYGYYPAFVEYPGSCSLSYATFTSAVYEILEGILRAGARSVVVLNTGISTIAPLEEAIARSGAEEQVRLVNCYQGPHYRAAAQGLAEQVRGSHADELETSIMLAIAPEWVNMKRAEACTEAMVKGPLNRTDPQAANYSPSGVYGDPRLATREKGERLVCAMLRDVLDVIEALRDQT